MYALLRKLAVRQGSAPVSITTDLNSDECDAMFNTRSADLAPDQRGPRDVTAATLNCCLSGPSTVPPCRALCSRAACKID